LPMAMKVLRDKSAGRLARSGNRFQWIRDFHHGLLGVL
jgi:hypothetical protein